MEKKVLNIGSLNIDRTYRVHHFVSPGETMSALSYEEFEGGKGLNQSVSLARAGAQVFHCGYIGSDGDGLRRTLEENQVNVDLVRTVNEPTGHAIIQVDDKGENNIIVWGGSNMLVDKKLIDEALEHFSKGDYLLLQNEVSHVEYAMQKAAHKGLSVVLNPSPVNKALLETDLSLVDVFILNVSEAQSISGYDGEDLSLLREKLLIRYPEAEFVVTLGDKGSCYISEEDFVQVPAKTVDVVDTTGAGDTFTGYYLAERLKGKSQKEALTLATIASSIAITRKGASMSIPTYQEVEKAKKGEKS